MADVAQLQQSLAGVLNAVAAYTKTQSVPDYKALQHCVRSLQVAAAKPEDTLFTFRLQVVANEAIVMLIEMGVLDAIVAKQGGIATATELAKSTGCDEQVITRLMRVATALHFCDELSEKTYGANTITRHLTEDGWKGALRWMDIIYPVAGGMRTFLAETDFHIDSMKPSKTAFEFVHDKPMWKVLEENPDQRRNFDLWMRERRKNDETKWDQRFPPSTTIAPSSLKSDSKAAFMVDVGGANGSQLFDFKAQFPNIPGRFVLQDLPESVAAVKTPPKGIEVMSYDFFTPQPVKGARYYYFRNVFHNWPDHKCVEILRNVVPAMDAEYSTVLIDDYVLPDTRAELRSAIADIHMMTMFNSSERTARQYADILAEAGLKIVTVHPTGANEESIIEAVLTRN